jgi:hypothetical protein
LKPGKHGDSLSTVEKSALLVAIRLDKEMSEKYADVIGKDPLGFVKNIEDEDVEKLRFCLTELLARVGFDNNYELNPQGEVIERVIDKLHLRT